VNGAAPGAPAAIEIGLNAAIVAVEPPTPLILVVPPGEGTSGADVAALDGLPFGPFDPLRHRTLEIGLRAWVAEQTARGVGYVEQLYTFADRGRHARPGDEGPHVVSVGYLALTRRPSAGEPDEAATPGGAAWRPWYGYFPWEDWRDGRPPVLDAVILPALDEWVRRPAGPSAAEPPAERRLGRAERLRFAFGTAAAGGGVATAGPWDEERVLERYELLYQAGLVEEARRDGREEALARAAPPPLGRPMRFDHRRILATAIARLRAKLKYRPVVFELMAETFTLTELQRTVEAIAGRHLHKQNFRRLVEATALVEPTGETTAATGGRPAQLYRFRREVVSERPSPGLRFGTR